MHGAVRACIEEEVDGDGWCPFSALARRASAVARSLGVRDSMVRMGRDQEIDFILFFEGRDQEIDFFFEG